MRIDVWFVTAVTALSMTAAVPASAAPAEVVHGNYSAGPEHAWEKLPNTKVGAGQGRAVDATVVIDPAELRQRYEGVGFSIDETSVSNLWKLTPAQRRQAIRLLADPERGAGLDRFRVTIGSPDLIEHLPFWSYNELPAGVTEDFELKHFSIQRDVDLHIIDTIKMIQAVNPRATFFASAWSAPAWMKTNNRFTGEVALLPGSTSAYYQVGKLRDDCVDVFARYYVKFLQAYRKHGIKIDALTLLNEPGMDVVYPAMDIDVAQQKTLAKAIKRELAAAGLNTQLYVHDFNFWDWRDPNSTETKNYHRIFEDPATRAASDGIAFHPYWGDPKVMREAYEEFGKPVHMTETSDLSPATIASYFRLDASSYVLWAQTTDQDGGTLHWTDQRDNDVDWAEVGRTSKWPNRLVTVNTETKTYSVRDELYAIGQFARYLDPSFTRLQSSAPAAGVTNVVFRDRAHEYVAVLGNSTATARSVRVTWGGQSFVADVPAGAYATYRWNGWTGSRPNRAPQLAPVAGIAVDQYATTAIPLTATDRDGDRLAYYATELPAGVTLDPVTGVLSVRPTVPGTLEFEVRVTDGRANDRVTVRVAVTPRGAPIGEIVEAEAYSEQHGWTEGGPNFIENTPAASGGRNIGWTAPGNWLKYRVDVPEAGTYDLELRVANGMGAALPGAITAGGTTVSVPDTGGWAAYASVHTTVDLPAG